MSDLHEFHTVRGYQLLEQNSKSLTPAMEDYIEMIYRSNSKEGYIRTSTLSELLNVKPPSVSKMIQKLTNMGLVNYKKYGIISLTMSGNELGKFLLERHNIIESFLKNIGANHNTFVETELIEHSISASTVGRIKLLNALFESNPDLIADLDRYIHPDLNE